MARFADRAQHQAQHHVHHAQAHRGAQRGQHRLLAIEHQRVQVEEALREIAEQLAVEDAEDDGEERAGAGNPEAVRSVSRAWRGGG